MRTRITFDQCDSYGEVCDWLNKIRQDQDLIESKIEQNTKDIEALKQKKSKKKGDAKEKAKAPKRKKKGSVLMKTVISLAIVVMIAVASFGAYKTTDINYTIASNPEMLSQYLRDSFANMTSSTYLFTPGSQPSTADTVEGKVYYDSSANLLYVCLDGSNWTSIDTGAVSGYSLDASYNEGYAIDVDGTAVTLTTSNADDNIVLAIVQNEADNDNDALTITMGTNAIGKGILINSQSGGTDIAGDNWSIDQAGLLTILEIAQTGDVLFNGTTYDVAFDASREGIVAEDNAIIGFGATSHNDAPDLTISCDGTNVLVEVATQDGADWLFGATNALDVKVMCGTPGAYWLFDTDDSAKTLICEGTDIMMMDGDFVIFGDGSDFTVTSASTKNLTFTPAAASDDYIVSLGSDQSGVHLALFGATASTTLLWDATNDRLQFDGADMRLEDTDILGWGDDDDMTFAFDGGDLDILGDGLEIAFGVDDEGIDIFLHGAGTGNYVKWDEAIDTLVFVDGNLKLSDEAEMYIGTKTNDQTADGDFKIQYIGTTRMNITSVGAQGQVCIGDGSVATDFLIDNITTAGADIWFDASAESAAGILYIGIDGKGIDTKFFGDAASSYMLWDMSVDTLKAVDSDILLDNESLLLDIVDTTGTKVELGTPFYIIFKPDAEADLAYVCPAGYDIVIIDAWGYKTAGAGANADDEWLLTNDEGGAAAIFAQVELNGVGDGDRVAFTDMDDGEAEINAGETLTLNADENAGNGCDGIVVVSCVLKVAD